MTVKIYAIDSYKNGFPGGYYQFMVSRGGNRSQSKTISARVTMEVFSKRAVNAMNEVILRGKDSENPLWKALSDKTITYYITTSDYMDHGAWTARYHLRFAFRYQQPTPSEAEALKEFYGYHYPLGYVYEYPIFLLTEDICPEDCIVGGVPTKKAVHYVRDWISDKLQEILDAAGMGYDPRTDPYVEDEDAYGGL